MRPSASVMQTVSLACLSLTFRPALLTPLHAVDHPHCRVYTYKRPSASVMQTVSLAPAAPAKDAAGMYEVTHIHPLIEYYQGALFMDHGGYKRLRKRLLEYPPATEQVRGHGWVGGDGGGGPVPRGALFLDRWIYKRLKRRSIPTL